MLLETIEDTKIELIKYKSYTELAMELAEDPILVLTAMNAQAIRWEQDDLAQELRFHIFRQLRKYNPAIASIPSWTFIVCKNKIIDLSRRNKRKGADPLERPHISIDKLLTNTED
jgi:DNA-directed RNA polymerase specialized sigma24 family protein